VSRNGHTFKHWPQLCEELAHAVTHDAVVDGEIVCLDAPGRSNFKGLLFRREWPYLYAFDLLAVDGEDLREWPLVERKRRLRRLIPSVPTRLLYVDHLEARGRDFFEVACAHDLESIVPSSRAVVTMRTARPRSHSRCAHRVYPQYFSIQSTTSLITAFRGRAWDVSYTIRRLCSAGVPRNWNIGSCDRGGG
jgi:hypothetical protein